MITEIILMTTMKSAMKWLTKLTLDVHNSVLVICNWNGGCAV